MRSVLCLAGISAAAMLALAGAAEAGKCKGRACRAAPPPYADEGAYRYVRAEASTGGKTVIGPVRAGKWGDQVRTPAAIGMIARSPANIRCARLTVDFWERARAAPLRVAGYFRFDVDIDTGHVYRRGTAFPLGRY